MFLIVWIATNIVGMFCSDQPESHRFKHLADSKHESLWIKVFLDKTKLIFFSVVYRPPSTGSDLESTDKLSKAMRYKNVLVISYGTP